MGIHSLVDGAINYLVETLVLESIIIMEQLITFRDIL